MMNLSKSTALTTAYIQALLNSTKTRVKNEDMFQSHILILNGLPDIIKLILQLIFMTYFKSFFNIYFA